jgi:hypothetical protein
MPASFHTPAYLPRYIIAVGLALLAGGALYQRLWQEEPAGDPAAGS